jgi:hypothetical protein
MALSTVRLRSRASGFALAAALVAVWSVAPTMVGCSSCTTEADDAFVLTVTDAKTGAPICDAVVNVTDGPFMTSPRSTPVSPVCVYQGPSERAGHYAIHVSHPGYVSQDTEVTISQDQCHVVGQKVKMELMPSP